MLPRDLTTNTLNSQPFTGFGLIGYELMTGTLPYTDYPNGDVESSIRTGEVNSLAEQSDDVPADLNNVILKALSRDPSERHETVLHLRDALQEAL